MIALLIVRMYACTTSHAAAIAFFASLNRAEDVLSVKCYLFRLPVMYTAYNKSYRNEQGNHRVIYRGISRGINVVVKVGLQFQYIDLSWCGFVFFSLYTVEARCVS